MKTIIILIIFTIGTLVSCAKIEHLAESLPFGRTKTVDAGYGDDPASMIASETAIRNNIEHFINKQTIYETVYFGPNSAILDEAAKEILWKKILWLEENPATVVVIEGHSDSLGSETANLIMGERRSESVKAFLIELGIADERLITVSYGEERLADSGETEEGRAKNRRVTFSIR